MIMVDKASWPAMEAANKSKTKGIIRLLTTILDPPEEEGVKAAPGINKQRPRQNVDIMARKDIERESAGRSVVMAWLAQKRSVARAKDNVKVRKESPGFWTEETKRVDML